MVQTCVRLNIHVTGPDDMFIAYCISLSIITLMLQVSLRSAESACVREGTRQIHENVPGQYLKVKVYGRYDAVINVHGYYCLLGRSRVTKVHHLHLDILLKNIYLYITSLTLILLKALNICIIMNL